MPALAPTEERKTNERHVRDLSQRNEPLLRLADRLHHRRRISAAYRILFHPRAQWSDGAGHYAGNAGGAIWRLRREFRRALAHGALFLRGAVFNFIVSDAHADHERLCRRAQTRHHRVADDLADYRRANRAGKILRLALAADHHARPDAGLLDFHVSP